MNEKDDLKNKDEPTACKSNAGEILIYLKKERYSGSKTDKVRAFLDKSIKFSIENL